ncbi:hypothetical protein [Verrucomicrobium sp. 3C]|uniref:hypothetical protein n=1 Tax=Verrucomicrobium sp. 3C TaxID=1134055 RepID=UPI0012DECF7A|nr:hypothetical protein [Verrucomicrobium sp. 3C]
MLDGVRFAYGQEVILQPLSAGRIVNAQTKTGNLVRKREGSAVSYRILSGTDPGGGCSRASRRNQSS